MTGVTTIVFLVIIVFLTILGYAKGLFSFVFGLVSWLVSLVLILFLGPIFEDMLMNRSGFYDSVVLHIGELLSERTNQLISPEQAQVSEMIAALTTKMIHGLSRVLAVVFALISCAIIGTILKILDKIPVIGDVGKFLGTLMGFVSGVLICLLIMYLAGELEATNLGTAIINDITANPVLLYIYENNPLKLFL